MKKTWTEDEIALMAEKAAGMHATGCNCAQSVFLMFAEEGGLDPETATTGGNALGFDMGNYPTAKSIIFGVNLEF